MLIIIAGLAVVGGAVLMQLFVDWADGFSEEEEND